MDGVIIDSEPVYHTINCHVLDHYGVTDYNIADFSQCIGMTTRGTMELFARLYNINSNIDEIIAYHDKVSRDTFFNYNGKPISGIPELVKELTARNIPLAVASSSPLDMIEKIIGNFGLASYFKMFVSGQEVPNGKPAPDIFLEAARRMNVKPEECLVIEDSKNGTIAAKTANMTCIGYQNPNSGNQDLSRADEIVKTIADIDISKYF